MEDKEKSFHNKLKGKIDDYVHYVYKLTRSFPKEEMYGVTSQLRRSTLSVMLNYVEGYARQRDKVYKNFLEISYGSLKESMYLIDFSQKEDFINEKDYIILFKKGDEIGSMLWGILRNLKS